MKVPSNHRQAERKLIQFVESGEWSIDDEGRIWRMRTWRGNPIKPRRAEKRGGKYLGISRMKDGVYIIGFAHRLRRPDHHRRQLARPIRCEARAWRRREVPLMRQLRVREMPEVRDAA